MQAANDVTFWSLGAGAEGELDRQLDGKLEPHPVPVQERIRRLPEALLLTAGYYGSHVRVVRELLAPRD